MLRLAEQLARQRDDLLGAREAAAAVTDGPATENIAEGITDNIKLARRLLEEHAGEPQDWLRATAATAEASQPDAEVSLTTEDPVPPAAVSSGSAWSAARRGEERHQGTPSPEAVLPLPGKTKRGEEQREEQQIDVGGATRWSRGPAAPAIPAHRNEAPADPAHVEESGAWVLASVNARGSVTDFTVVDMDRTLAECVRVLKPGGQFLFLEHVLSETDAGLADAQIKFTPFQVQAADGCHLDRRTLQNIKAAAFKSVDSEYFDLDGFLYLNPTIAGIATV